MRTAVKMRPCISFPHFLSSILSVHQPVCLETLYSRNYQKAVLSACHCKKDQLIIYLFIYLFNGTAQFFILTTTNFSCTSFVKAFKELDLTSFGHHIEHLL